MRLLREPELEDGVLSKLRNPIFLTGVELLLAGDSVALQLFIPCTEGAAGCNGLKKVVLYTVDKDITFCAQ